VTVPNVVGNSKTDAESKLSAAGLQVQTTSQESTTVAPDTVISQSPTGKVPPGSTITLVVAKAPPMVAVPSVGGQKAADAVKALKAAGFKVTQSTQTVTDPAQNGVVVSQSPAAGTQVPKGSEVKLSVGHYHATTTPTTPTTTPTTTLTTTTPTTPGQ
jgi:serine/threonine-protein kinase